MALQTIIKKKRNIQFAALIEVLNCRVGLVQGVINLYFGQ